ncbi:HEAT repeat domain-containing protein [Streptomyces sp. TLI_105]|uniref:HEAT repeat domain-containing protein n=1 Tax=Streptomyces sp. TLI_105 TaxID=1881019 RepID=UPI00089BACAB|nr:HEAT repeat domain-containing protein [Streptomyces sp. TLI_105]SEC08283.1 PBS lyase HEAT-like repeat-containing protein [Streptomyces sp. TLI_105]
MEISEDPEFCSMIDRLRDEIENDSGEVPAAFTELTELAALTALATLAGCEDRAGGEDRAEELHRVLTALGQPLWAREIAAYSLGVAGDPRAFEALVLLLNHRDPERCVTAAHALTRLGDPRTARAAAALATNELRVAYALVPVRLLAELRAPESVPALITVLGRRLRADDPHWRVGLACVEGLGALGDPRARAVLREALPHPRLGAEAGRSLHRLDSPPDPEGTP